MAKGVSGKRHAQAVFQIALEKNELSRWQADLETIASVLGNPQVVAVLENPKLNLGQKREILQNTLPGIGPTAMNLASFLVARNRLRIVPDLVAEFARLLNDYYGREQAEVTTAVPISDEEKEKIKRNLATIVGREIVLDLKTDPDIIGGLVARFGDKLIDGSVRTRLQDLRRSLV